jgi:hypothetical protein
MKICDRADLFPKEREMENSKKVSLFLIVWEGIENPAWSNRFESNVVSAMNHSAPILNGMANARFVRMANCSNLRLLRSGVNWCDLFGCN